MSQKLTNAQLEQLLNRAQRNPTAIRGLTQEQRQQLVAYEQQQTKRKPATPGGRGSMTRQQKSDYISEHGSKAYLALPW